MKRHPLKPFIMIIASALLMTACARPVTIRGQVFDAQLNPIKGAAVETVPATDTVTTNRKGYFFLRQILNDEGEPLAIPAGKYQLRITKDGFEEVERTITVEGGETRLARDTMKERVAEVLPTPPTVTPHGDFTNHDVSTPIGGSP